MAWCWVCMSSDCVMRLPKRPRSEMQHTPRRATARELAAAAWTMVESKPYPEVRFLSGAFALLYGGPGAGKSTMGMKLLDGIDGPVLYAAIEEGLGPAVAERCSRLAVRRADFHLVSGGNVDHLAEEVRQTQAKALCLDSVTVAQFLPREVRQLQESTKLPLLVGTAQVNKAGQVAGLKGWTHEADVVLSLDEGGFTLEKSRYQPVGIQGEV